MNIRGGWFLISLCIGSIVLGNDLINPTLDADAHGDLPGWYAYRGESPDAFHYRFDSKVIHTGKTSVYLESTEDKNSSGLLQIVTYDQPTNTPILFGGWSKCEDVTGGRDYCIYLDIHYADGTPDWAKCAHWSTGTHDWEETRACFWPAKPVAKIEFFVLLRKVKGKAWVDDFELTRARPDAQLGAIKMKSTAPLSYNGIHVSSSFFMKDTSYSARLESADGRLLASKDGNGPVISWLAKLKEPAARLVIVGRGKNEEGKVVERVYEKPVNVKPDLPENTVKQGYRIWTADSMTNVSPATYPAGDAETSISLELAKAEYESAQIQITTAADTPLSNVQVTLPTLKNAAGQELKGALKWERVGYIPRQEPYAFHPEGYSTGQFWLPDPLLPPRPFPVPANATQGVWLTVHADRDAVAGTYTGNVVVTADNKQTIVPLSVTVFNFALPKTFSYPTAFCIMDGFLNHVYNKENPDQIRRIAWDIMLDHRLNPDDISRTDPPRIEDLLYARERGMNRFNIFNLVPYPKNKGLWVCYSPLDVYTPKLFEEFKQRLDPYVAELKKHDLAKYAYLYGFDERNQEYYPVMGQLHKMLKERYPEVAFFTTSRMYKDLVEDPTRTDCYGNDWYCPLTSNYVPELSDKLRAKGYQVWWYTCCGPQYPYANMASIEYPFIEGRLLAWMSYKYKADGFLYWHVNLWNTPLRLDESSCYQPDFKASSVIGMVGDGQFLYPGEKQPLPSIRLANIRDGSEDYDYLALGKDSSACDSLVTDMKNYTRDPRALRQARRELAGKIMGK